MWVYPPVSRSFVRLPCDAELDETNVDRYTLFSIECVVQSHYSLQKIKINGLLFHYSKESDFV